MLVYQRVIFNNGSAAVPAPVCFCQFCLLVHVHPFLFLVSSPYTLVNLVKTNFYMSWGSHIETNMNQNKHVVELMRFCGIGLSTNTLAIGQKDASNSNSRNFGWVLYVLLVQLKG